MAQEVLVVLSVVIPDDPPDSRARIRDLHGRELPGVPGSWVSRVAILTRGPGTEPHAGEQRPTSPPGAARSSASGAACDTDNPAGDADGDENSHRTAPGASSGRVRNAPLGRDELEHELDLDFGVAASDD